VNFLLDTCVISELTRPVPDAGVVAWITSQQEARLYLSVITIGEVRRGIERLPNTRKRRRIESWLNNELGRRFSGRFIPVGDEVAERWGLESAKADKRGTPLPVIDGLIAATGLVHGMTVVTRDHHMAQTGVELWNPWQP